MKCWARRHMTPLEFMVYDAMFHMASPPDRLCFSSINGVANRTSLGRDSVIKCMKSLVAKGWLIPDPDQSVRWQNTGRWANNRYIVVTHDNFKGVCPPLKYDPETGENMWPASDRRVGDTDSDRVDTIDSDRVDGIDSDREITESTVSTHST